MADFMHYEGDQKDFDAELYVKILITIAKADKENGPREFDFVKKQAKRFGIDTDAIWNDIDKKFSFSRLKISRPTALAVLRDCIILASLDGNFSLSEKERTYAYAAKLNIPRLEVEYLEKWVQDYHDLKERWKKLLDGYLI
jgi:tellurite resistance protein